MNPRSLIILATLFAAFLQLQMACPCAAQTPDDPVRSRLDRVLVSLPEVIVSEMQQQNIPGAVIAVVHQGEVVLLQGFGHANVATQREVQPESTLFRLGSISKALSLLALAKCCEENNIAINENVFEHVSALPTSSHIHGPVAFAHLLEHTGGFDQIGTGRVFKSAAARPNFQEFLSRDLKSIRPAGQLACYDTYGPTLAGYAIEQISGAKFGDWMREKFFQPAGMRRTFVESPPHLREDLAVGYGVVDGQLVPMDYEFYTTTAASSIDSTAADMAKLMIAILADGSHAEGRLLSSELCQKVKTVSDRPNAHMPRFTYGFWEMFRRGNLDRRILQHGGQVDGYSTTLCLVPEESFGVFMAVNRNSETGPSVTMVEEIPFGLIDRALAFTPAKWFESFDPEPVETKRLAGKYIPNLYCHTRFEGDGWPPRGRVVQVDADGPGKIRIMGDPFLAVDALNFQSPGSQQTVQFHEREDGTICGLSYNFRAPGTTYEKLDEALVAEVFGELDAGEPNPLAALVYRTQDDFAEAATIYAQHADDAEDDLFSKPWANYRAASCLMELGEFARAEQRLVAAMRQFLAFESEDELATEIGFTRAAKDGRNESAHMLVIALTAQGKIDAAEKIAFEAVREFGPNARNWLATLQGDPRMQELFSRPKMKQLLQHSP